MRAVTNDPQWEALLAQMDAKQADLNAANRCTETLPHHATPGVCDRCGTVLTGRRTRWCSNGCQNEWRAQHDWSSARYAAKRRDGHRCTREGCDVTTGLEVNHIDPRVGRGYGFGCHNHAGNLETLCRRHHAEVTTGQREARDAVAWFERTGHCHSCGQPGDWCQCTRPCRCAALHEHGSGIGRDPASVFTDQPPAQQETLL